MDYKITALLKPEKIINKYFKIKNQIIIVEDVAFQKKGEIYYQVRFLTDGYRTYTTYKSIRTGYVSNPYISSNSIGYSLGEIDYDYPNIEKLKKRYEDMFGRCYNSKDRNYKIYGNFGITVNPLWWCFETYANDIISMKGFHPSLLCEENRIQLDKDYLQMNKKGKSELEYGKYTCLWLLMETNSGLQKRDPYKYKLENKTGKTFYFYDLVELEDFLKENAYKSFEKFLEKKKQIKLNKSKNVKFTVGTYTLQYLL